MFEMMEFEWRPRGGRGMGRPMGRPMGRARPRPGRGPQPGQWPRPRPRPVYGAWPYPVPMFEPLPLLEPAPPQEPEPWDEPVEGEAPPTIARAVAQMPAALRPSYIRIAALERAPDDPRTHGPGLYYLEFTVNGQRRGYSGQARHIGKRLAQHRTCAGMMGIGAAQVDVYIAPNLGDDADRRRREWTLHDTMLNNYRGVLTNQRRELEMGVLGEEHETACGCKRCQQGPFSAEQEMELAMELLAVQSEEELEQFLGKMFKGIWRGIRKVAKPLGGVLKGIAKKALPFVGGALGSMIPIPGVGTALGSALGGALSKALEMEMENMPGIDREFEMARRFVRIAGSAAQAAGEGDGSPQAVRRAVLEALRANAPGFGRS